MVSDTRLYMFLRFKVFFTVELWLKFTGIYDVSSKKQYWFTGFLYLSLASKHEKICQTTDDTTPCGEESNSRIKPCIDLQHIV